MLRFYSFEYSKKEILCKFQASAHVEKMIVFKTPIIMITVTEIFSMLKITSIEKNLCEFYLILLLNGVFKDEFF